MIETRRALSHEETRALYDRVGRKQDRYRFYEDPATRRAIRRADLANAKAVFEFGCGTGRFAETLLDRHLPSVAQYVGVDVSRTMVALASRRLARFGCRAQVRLTDGSPHLDVASATFDRFHSNYVLDLLSVEDVREVLDEAHRILTSGGLAAIVGLTHGSTCGSRLIERALLTIHSVRPSLVGGCRPLDLTEFIGTPKRNVCAHETLTRFMIPSQVVIARKEF